MLRYLPIIVLLFTSDIHASELPSSLYGIELGKPINQIEHVTKARMKGLYSVKVREGQLVEPLHRLLVKVDKKTNIIVQIIGEAEVSSLLCVNQAKKLKERYEEQYSISLEERSHQGDLFFIVNKDKKFFFIGCENKRKTILRVSLSDI